MKKNLLCSMMAIALLSFSSVTFGQVLNLGTLTNFAAYTGTGAVSNTGTSTLTGDVGTNVGAISGFGLPTTAGLSFNANATTTQAKIDLLRVYIHLSDLAVTNTTHAAAFGSGESITAGVYKIAGAGSVAGALTLNGQGNPNAAFIIKFEGGFSAAAGSTIILANGTRACNVFWIAEGAISIGAATITKGTLIAHPGAVTIGAGSTLEGRMFSTEGAISFGPVVASLPVGPITIPISCVNTCNNNILGTAANFALFTSVGAVANAATSGIIGDIGSNAGDISGFASSTVAGSFYNVNAVTAQAKIDLQAAYVQLVNIPVTNTSHTPAFGSGETLTAGVYSIAAAGSLAGTITLDGQGNPDAMFIFRFGGAFTTAAQSKVILTNGVRRCNIFWIAEGAVSMGTFTFMKGTLIAHNGANTMGANGNLEGRMLSTTGAIGFSTGVIYTNTMCFSDPVAVILAVNDAASINGFTGGTLTNVLSNDTLGGVAAVPSQVTIAFVSSTNAGITLSGTNVIVAAGTPAGTYTLIYRICQISNPTNCSQATVTINVTAPVIAAVNDAITVNVNTGGTLTNVLSNDKLNGVAVAASQITTVFVSSTNAGITLSGTNVIVAAGTPVGAYALVYRICQISNPNNCSQATVTVTVVCASIAAPTLTIIQPTCLLATGKITVTAPTGSAYTYSLNGGAYQINPIFSALGANSYSITVKSGTCSSAASTAVLNAPIRPASPSVSVIQPTCALATGTITVTAPIGAAFTYSINGSTFQTSPIFNCVTTRSYNVTVQSGSCISTVTIVVVNAQPAAPATPTVTISQMSVTLATATITVTSPLGSGLTYSINGINYQSSPVFSGITVANSYRVTVKNGYCTSPAKIALVYARPPLSDKVADTSFDAPVKTELKVILAPNPSSGSFGLDVQTLSQESISVKIIDETGRIIDQLQSNPQDAIQFGNDLSSGLYFIEITQGNKRKLVRAQKL